MSPVLEQRLRDGLGQLGLDATHHQVDTLMRYLGGLAKWNQAYNLTAVRDPEQMVVRHLLDSLAVVPHSGQGRLIDVGTGAGLPGMVLAIMQPERPITLLDSNGKKTRFLRQMAVELGLPTVTVVQARVEAHRDRYNVISSRAFASLADMVNWSAHLLAENGHFLAMKGQLPADEISALPAPYRASNIIRLAVPSLDEERHLVCIDTAVPADQ